MIRADPHRALCRAIAARYPGLTLVEGRSEDWASATFSGARHVLVLTGDDAPAGIGEVDFALPGHFVADIEARHEAGRIVIEALTIEEA